MASISSLTSSSSSSIYGSRSSNMITGLASGLDTESLVQGMVQGIKSKIDKQNQQKTLLGWQQEAYRSVSDQLVSLSSKYMSYTSSSNLMSSSFFGSSSITSMGAYANKISATGKSDSTIEILGVHNLATNTSVTFSGLNGKATDNTTITASDGVSLNGQTDVSNFAGKSITFEYGSRAITVSFGADAKDMSQEDVAKKIEEEFNKQAEAAGINGKISLTANGGSITVNNSDSETKLKVTAGSEETLNALGLQKDKELNQGDSVTVGDLKTKKYNYEILSGTSINVTYDGKSGVLNLPSMDGSTTADKIIASLNEQLAKQFGDGRVTVSNAETNGDLKLQFNVADGENGRRFTINSASDGLLGTDGLLGLQVGATNGINTNMTLEQLGIEVGNGKFTINGVEIGNGAYTKDTKLSDIISDINNSDAGVRVTYSQTTNQFLFTSTQDGKGGNIKIEDGDLAAKIFGTVDTTKDKSEIVNSGAKIANGQDATIAVKVNGQNMILTSGTNSFNVDGMTITAEGIFNEDSFKEDSTGAVISNFDDFANVESVTLNQKVDADKIVNAIKSFVEEYNAMLDNIGELYTTKPDSKYSPLTDDQKADMTEKQIEEWEKKAKEGLLFGDSDLSGLSSSLRFLFSNSQLSEIGIKTSDKASDRGKLVLDEDALRAALAEDPDKVQKALAEPKGADGVGGGAIVRLNDVIEKYAKTTGSPKGILIEKAGSEHSATSLIQNSIQKQMDDIDDMIEKLTEQLNDKIDFYTSKFSKLEVLISQANSQSSYLAGMSGGY